MAFDGLFLAAVCREIEDELLTARVDKIYQPSKEEIIFVMRFAGGTRKLLCNVSANSARVHLTRLAAENPKTPPMFCMFLRKHLGSAKLIGVRQWEMDRVLFLDFATLNELGDEIVITVAVEIMGRHSNFIVIGSDGRIMDAMKRVTTEMSSVRAVLPGMQYTEPPKQEKYNLLTAPWEQAKEALLAQEKKELSKALMQVYQGMSPLIARELTHAIVDGMDLSPRDLSAFRWDKLQAQVQALQVQFENNEFCFTVLLEGEQSKDFAFCDIHQYGSLRQKRRFESAGDLLDFFYRERDRVARVRQRSNDLWKMLVNFNERAQRKLALQQQELRDSEQMEQHKQYGDLIHANLWQIGAGDRALTTVNFYDPEQNEVTIPLDPRYTPAQNAQRYYHAYQRAKNAREKLVDLIVQTEQELAYFDSVLDAISRSDGESELLEIREELAEQGYLKHFHRQRNQKMIKPQPPLQFRSTDGFTILCGRNNTHNDRLTLRIAKNYDLWLHTQKIAGSHVVILNDVVKDGVRQPISDLAIEQAAMIAAFHSKGRESAQVPVDYTLIKYVKKPKGAKPGMVIYTNQQTAYVTPNAELIEQLRVTP